MKSAAEEINKKMTNYIIRLLCVFIAAVVIFIIIIVGNNSEMQACPTRALTMTHEIEELVGPNRTGLIYEKQDLLAPVPDGALEVLHPMVEGTEDGDYYRGEVTGVTQAQISWVREHRPD